MGNLSVLCVDCARGRDCKKPIFPAATVCLTFQSWREAYLELEKRMESEYDRGFEVGKEYHRRMGDDNPFIQADPAAAGGEK